MSWSEAGRNRGDQGGDERRELLRNLLLGMLVLLAVATGLDVLARAREGALSPVGLALDAAVAASLLAGLWMLGRGRFRSVVWLVTAVLMATAVHRLRDGLDGYEADLLIFIAPISLVGLLLGRVPLFLTAGGSLAAVVAVFLLHRLGSPLPATDDSAAVRAIVTFAVIVGLLVLLLDRFALTLQDSLALSRARERELRREIERRRELELRLRIAADEADMGFWTWIPSTEELQCSDKMKELLGYEREHAVSVEAFLGRVHLADRARVETMMRATEPTEPTEPFRVVLPDTGTRWLVGRGRVLMQERGEAVHLGTVIDVTRLKEAELGREALLEREQAARLRAESAGERLAFLAEASQVLGSSLDYPSTLRRVTELAVPRMADWCSVYLVDDSGDLTMVASTHVDAERAELAEEMLRRYPPDPEAKAGIHAVQRTGVARLIESVDDDLLRSLARDDTHREMLERAGFSSAIMAPLVSRGQKLGVLLLVQSGSGRRYDAADLDLALQLAERAAVAVDNARLFAASETLNAELERRVEERTLELQAANRELESFSYTASHDLRAPLRGINGFSEALLEDYGDRLDDTAKTYLERIHAGAVRMGELIDDLLELARFSRAEAVKAPVDLTALARGVTFDLAQLEPDRSVTVEIEDGMHVCSDERLLRIALGNLIGNAWKFTSHREHACIAVGWDRDRRAFFVRDNGAGFSMEYVGKLFSPFQRLHSADAYKGSGIGLATTKRIIERLGGEVWGEGVEGEGATFYFTLSSGS